jgi:hypothetical protein
MKIAIADDRFGRNGEEPRVFTDFSVAGPGRADPIAADCHTEQDLVAACSGADAILFNRTPMTAGLIAALDKYRENYPGGEITRTEAAA